MDKDKLADLLPEVVEQIKNGNSSVVVTGFEQIDTLMNINDGAVITIAGRPAMGKTAFMLSILGQLMQKNKKALLFSLEMSKEQIVKRLIGMNAEISANRLRMGDLDTSDIEKMSEFVEKMCDWDLFLCDTAGISVDDIECYIDKHNPQYVFIDYLQLIEGKSKKDRNFQLDSIMQQLREIAKERGIIIFLLSQLSRGLEYKMDKRPILSDLKGSAAIENLSDVMIFLYRPEYYNNDADELQKGETEVIFGKNKFGFTEVIRMIFDHRFVKFSSCGVNYDEF